MRTRPREPLLSRHHRLARMPSPLQQKAALRPGISLGTGRPRLFISQVVSPCVSSVCAVCVAVGQAGAVLISQRNAYAS